MGLVNTLSKRLRSKKETGESTVWRIARSEAAGRVNANDAKNLEAALLAAGQTEEDYAEALLFMQCAGNLEKDAGDIDELGAKAHEARRIARDFRDAAISREKANAEQLRELNRDAQNAISAMDRAQQASNALSALQTDFPERFGLEPRNLDAYTLTSGRTVINVADPAAEPLAVSSHVFIRESARRQELLESAHAEARAEHERAHAAWTLKNSRQGIDGQTFVPEGVKGEPEWVLPTWATIAGRNGSMTAKAPKPKGAKA